MTDRAERNSQSIQSILEKWEQFYYYLPILFQYPAPQQYWGLTSNLVVTRGVGALMISGNYIPTYCHLVTRYVGAYHRNGKRRLCPTHCHLRASHIRLISGGVTLDRSHFGRSITSH
jgi:hypothetical protein